MNTPLPNPVNVNLAAMNAAASKAAKQANNDGQEFKQVLANQVKTKNANAKETPQAPQPESNGKTREILSKEQAQQLQRRQLQIKENAQAQWPSAQQAVDPALLAGTAQLAGQTLPQDPAAKVDLTENALDQTLDQALDPALASELQAKDASVPAAQVVPEVLAVPVSPAPAPRVAGAVRDALSEMQQSDVASGKQAIGLNLKDDGVEGGKLTTAELEALLDKSAATGTATSAKAGADTQAAPLTGEQGQRFAETLAQQTALQQASATGHTAQTPAAQALALDPRSTQVAIPFGQNGWNQAIGQKVMWMAAGGEQTATLTLNPPDLGPLQVVIHVHNGQADTTFLSDQADVRRALEDGMANLRDMMSQSGMQLGQADVRSGQQEAQSQSSGAGGQPGQDASHAGNEVNPVLAKAAKVMGMVDTYV